GRAASSRGLVRCPSIQPYGSRKARAIGKAFTIGRRTQRSDGPTYETKTWFQPDQAIYRQRRTGGSSGRGGHASRRKSGPVGKSQAGRGLAINERAIGERQRLSLARHGRLLLAPEHRSW